MSNVGVREPLFAALARTLYGCGVGVDRDGIGERGLVQVSVKV